MSADTSIKDIDPLIPPETAHTLYDMVSEIERFVALYEQAAEKIRQHEVLTGKRLAKTEAAFRSKVNEIDTSFKKMESLLTEAGVARFSVAAEEALRAGEAHLAAFRQVGDGLSSQCEQILQQFDAATQEAAAAVREAAQHVQLEAVSSLVKDATQRITYTTDQAVRRLTGTLSWLHWERISVIFIVVLVLALASSYIGGAWSAKTDVLTSREQLAGRATLRAWSQLSDEDRLIIKRALRSAPSRA